MDEKGSGSCQSSFQGLQEKNDKWPASKRRKSDVSSTSQDMLQDPQGVLDCEGNIEENLESDPLTVNDLFDELLQKIFSHFSALDLYGTIAKVCVRWERIAKDPCTLNKTQLFLDDKDQTLYMEVLKEAPCIGEVYILPSYPPDAMNYLIRGPTVRKLVIIAESEWYRNWPTPADLIALLAHNKLTLQHLTGMKRLSHLHLVGEYWRDWDEWDLSLEHPHLRTLKIDSLSFISDECPFIRDLIMLCKPTLRVLCLPCQLPDDASSLLNAGVFQGSLVEELMVSTGCLRVVSQMPHLKILAVSDNGKEDGDLKWFKQTPMLSGVWKLTLQSLMETEGERQGFVWHLLSKFNNVREFWGLESCIEEETFNMFLRNNAFLAEMHFFDFAGFDNPNQVKLVENFLPNLSLLDVSLTQVSEEMYSTLDSFNKRKPNLKIVLGDDLETEVIRPFTEGL
ncbi:uncharacterized protein LOC117640799 isoform X2 [Thrips palmi]|uniref:Uncharacterized protein LOC117640799 isoform X2 n=1 Tax=Thrips palmi TaxID=161013 RepID=A0A6P8YA24_THRPL|nr:uncharacterized protein LOC117640799 isoform X2 [Thrips palmi]